MTWYVQRLATHTRLTTPRRQLGALVALALVVRALLFDWVGVWGDMGFYTYDARLILAGERPYIDFIGRSPLFNYLYAGVVGVVGQPVRTVRWFIVIWWVLCAVPVYGIAARIRGHRAGLAAAALMLFTPFALVYGMWSNTQSLAAVLAITGLYAIVRRPSLRMYALAGALLGAAFLSRRSVIAIAAGIGLWTVWDWRAVRPIVARGVAAGAGFLAALAAGYLALAYGDLGTATQLAEVHAVGLLASSGRGGFPLITETAPTVAINALDSGRIPIFNDLCQLCGAWTARTFAKTLLVALPLAGIGFVYLHDWVRAYFSDFQRDVLVGVLLTLGGYAALKAALAGYPMRVGTVAVLAGMGYLTWRAGPLPRRLLYDRRQVLVVAVLALLAVAYLYRNRVLHTYYFMDFVPALAVACGVAYVAVWDRLDASPRQVAIAVLVLAIVVSTAGAHPLTNVLTGNSGGWFTMANIDDYQQDIEQRVGDGEVILSGHPSYVAGTDVRLWRDMPRIHYFATSFRGTDLVRALHADLQASLRSGQIAYVVGDPMTDRVLARNATTAQAFTDHFCRVTDADASELYAQTNATLYRYQPACPTARVPTVGGERTVP